MIEQATEVLGRESGGDGERRARVQQIEAHLGGVDHAGVEHGVDGAGVAERGDAGEPDLALAPQRGQGRHHLVDDPPRGQAAAGRRRAVLADDQVVKLEQVHALHAQALEARLQGARDGTGDIGLGRIDAELRAHEGTHADRPQREPEVAL
jgi:hypothetical protein